MDSKRKVESFVKLIDPTKIVLLKVIPKSLSGHGEVVVRNFGKEEMVNNVAVGNVMVQRVDSKAKLTVDSLESSVNIFPVLVSISYAIWTVMLQISHSDEPPAKNNMWSPIEESVIHKVSPRELPEGS